MLKSLFVKNHPDSPLLTLPESQAFTLSEALSAIFPLVEFELGSAGDETITPMGVGEQTAIIISRKTGTAISESWGEDISDSDNFKMIDIDTFILENSPVDLFTGEPKNSDDDSPASIFAEMAENTLQREEEERRNTTYVPEPLRGLDSVLAIGEDARKGLSAFDDYDDFAIAEWVERHNRPLNLESVTQQGGEACFKFTEGEDFSVPLGDVYTQLKALTYPAVNFKPGPVKEFHVQHPMGMVTGGSQSKEFLARHGGVLVDNHLFTCDSHTPMTGMVEVSENTSPSPGDYIKFAFRESEFEGLVLSETGGRYIAYLPNCGETAAVCPKDITHIIEGYKKEMDLLLCREALNLACTLDESDGDLLFFSGSIKRALGDLTVAESLHPEEGKQLRETFETRLKEHLGIPDAHDIREVSTGSDYTRWLNIYQMFKSQTDEGGARRLLRILKKTRDAAAKDAKKWNATLPAIPESSRKCPDPTPFFFQESAPNYSRIRNIATRVRLGETDAKSEITEDLKKEAEKERAALGLPAVAIDG